MFGPTSSLTGRRWTVKSFSALKFSNRIVLSIAFPWQSARPDIVTKPKVYTRFMWTSTHALALQIDA